MGVEVRCGPCWSFWYSSEKVWRRCWGSAMFERCLTVSQGGCGVLCKEGINSLIALYISSLKYDTSVMNGKNNVFAAVSKLCNNWLKLQAPVWRLYEQTASKSFKSNHPALRAKRKAVVMGGGDIDNTAGDRNSNKRSRFTLTRRPRHDNS